MNAPAENLGEGGGREEKQSNGTLFHDGCNQPNPSTWLLNKGIGRRGSVANLQSLMNGEVAP